MSWFRVDEGVVDDPKMQNLPLPLFRACINLWCITSQNGGNLPPIEDVAFKLRMTKAKAAQVVADLRKAELIDEDENGMRPHNWNGRQFKSDVTDPTAAERMRRHRNAKRNDTVTPTVTVTPPRADTEQNREEENAADAAPSLNGKYAFEEGVIRLTEKDFAKWKQAFERLDLAAELIALAPWAADQPRWFHAVSGALAKKNRECRARIEAVKGGPKRPEGYIEGII